MVQQNLYLHNIFQFLLLLVILETEVNFIILNETPYFLL